MKVALYLRSANEEQESLTCERAYYFMSELYIYYLSLYQHKRRYRQLLLLAVGRNPPAIDQTSQESFSFYFVRFHSQ